MPASLLEDEYAKDLDSRLHQFQAEWLRGDAPDVASYLSNTRDTDFCCRIIEIDLEFRWTQFRSTPEKTAHDSYGFPLFPHLEDYAPLLHQLSGDQVFSPHLIAEEYRVRTRWGDCPDRRSFFNRFRIDPADIETAFDSIDAKFAAPAGQKSSHPGEPADSPADVSTVATPAGHRHVDPQIGSTIAVPTRIGKYQLETILGRGGFGEVWKAHDPDLKRSVAIKFPRTDRSFQAEDLSSFRREAEKLAALDRVAGIVTVFDCGEQDGRPYIVSEFVDGTSLEQHLQHATPTPRESAQWIADAATALNRAHLKGLIHRDIKPSNILLDTDGRALIADFGLCITEHEQLQENRATVGTFAYMAPEQARGDSHRADGRADIYSLGVLLYRMLTGRLPFIGHRPAEYIDQILHREPRPPRSINPQIPAELERICLRCLSKPINCRYTTAADLAADLNTWLAEQTASVSGPASIPTPESTLLRVHKWLLGSALVFGLVMAAMAATAALNPAKDAERFRASPPPPNNGLLPLDEPKLIAWNPYSTHDSYGYEAESGRFRFDAFGHALFQTGFHGKETVELELRFAVKHWRGWAGVFWGERQAADGLQRCWTICAGRTEANPRYRVEIHESVIGPLSSRRSVVSGRFVDSFPASLPGDDQAVLKVRASVRQLDQVWLNSVPLLDEPLSLRPDPATDAVSFGLGFFGNTGDISVYKFDVATVDPRGGN